MAYPQAPAGLGCRPESEEVRPRPYAARKGYLIVLRVLPGFTSKPIPILGTNVRLDTPEEIAAWIAERKRRWPTDARVTEKKRKLEQAMANGELHPDHLALMGGKRFRPLSSDTDVTRTRRGRGGTPFGFGGSRGRSRGRGRGAYSRNRVHERSATLDGITSSAPTLPLSRSPAVKDTELPRPPSVPSALSVRGADADATLHLGSDDNDGDDDGDDDDDDAAPEVMSAKRPPGIVAYGSSSDSELEKPHTVNDHPGPTITSSSRSGPDAVSASQQSSLPKAESANRPRRVPPPQPKKPPRNPFAARPSLLRNVSESIIAILACLSP
jgi:Nuclear fragile X mental retardation-interacting protein 1 (NUFIP1)